MHTEKKHLVSTLDVSNKCYLGACVLIRMGPAEYSDERRGERKGRPFLNLFYRQKTHFHSFVEIPMTPVPGASSDSGRKSETPIPQRTKRPLQFPLLLLQKYRSQTENSHWIDHLPLRALQLLLWPAFQLASWQSRPQ